jgi:putative ABC transport system substrate-binding protein
MTKRAELLRLTLAFGLAWLPLAANAQLAEKPSRVGLLGSYSPTSPLYEAFRQGLRELGYVEGRNLIIEARFADGKLDRLPEFARELAGLNVNVMFVSGDQGLRAAKEATNTIPIVVSACDPIDSLVASVARPGGKATGFSCISSELAGKRLQLFKELVPELSRVAVLYNPEDRNKAWEYEHVQDAARSLNLALHAFEARSATEIDEASIRIADQRAQAVLIFADPLMFFNVKKLAEVAMRHKFPAMFGFREFPEAGGLISYGASARDQYRRVASYVDKILKGTDPGDLPIQQATRFELIINLKTAKALSLKIPDKLLALADEAID